MSYNKISRQWRYIYFFLFIGIMRIKDYEQKKKKMALKLETGKLPILIKHGFKLLGSDWRGVEPMTCCVLCK